MAREPDYLLEQSRADKIKTLGYICYNLYVDGAMAFPEMHGIVSEIKKTTSLMSSIKRSHLNVEYVHKYEKRIAELLEMLGMTCYNLYNDSKLINSKVLELCDSIATINSEMTSGFEAAVSRSSANRRSFPSEIVLEVECPEGMEPIPDGYITCSCGYRNKPEANFCGKCGAELD